MEDSQQYEIIDSSKQAANKPLLIVLISIIAALIVAALWLFISLQNANEANEQLIELAELDKQEMENQYKQFDEQYGELQKQIRNDSLLAQIEAERQRTQDLLKELEQTKATDAKEIARLKKEIATLRAVLQSYIVQIDSLNRTNEILRAENTNIKAELSDQTTKINTLSSEKIKLQDKVSRAAQLDATGFWISPKNKRGKDCVKAKDTKRFAFGFNVAKNVTAETGEKTIYARILNPNNSVYHRKGTFVYEGTSLEYSEKKTIEYTGEELQITMYCDVTEYLEAGSYKLFIFADDQMIGSTTFILK